MKQNNKEIEKEKIYCKFCRRLVSNKRGHPSLKYKLCSDCYELLRKHNVNEISNKFEKIIQSKEKEMLGLIKQKNDTIVELGVDLEYIKKEMLDEFEKIIEEEIKCPTYDGSGKELELIKEKLKKIK